jgi:nucleoside-diphosphate-sugar epimerase
MSGPKLGEPSPCTIVSGITGHVGRVLGRQLAVANAEVHGLTRQDLPLARPMDDRIEIHGVRDNGEELAQLFRRVRAQAVIHLAALAGRTNDTATVSAFIEANVLFGTRVLEAMRLSGCKRIVIAESILQFSGSGEYRPLTFYAATKQAFSDVLSYYVDACEMCAISLVLPTVYSEHETASKLMTDAARAWRADTVLKMGSEEIPLDYVHVDDVASAFLRACSLLDDEPSRGRGSFKRYWLSSGTYVTPTEVVERFERLGKKKLTIRRPSEVSSSRRGRPYLGPALPGWSPQIDLDTGIRRMLPIER